MKPPFHAVITGASGGIGRAVSVHLARQYDARLLLVYHQNLTAAESCRDEIRTIGGDAETLCCDLADPKQQPALVARAFEKLDRIDAWIHLAGIDVLTGDAAKWDFETKLRKLFEVDVLAAIHVCRRVANVWRGKHQTPVPSITLVGWDQATRGMEGDAGQMFGPVKAAVTAFGLSLAQDVAPEVRVNVVSPGWIRTSWGESTDDYWDRRAREQALMGRWGTPEDVARAVAFAADPLNSFCTGQVIEANGGFNRRFAGEA